MLESSEVDSSLGEHEEHCDGPAGGSRHWFKREVTLGDLATAAGQLLTVVSILISVLTLRHTYDSYREGLDKQQADQIRSAATETLAKMERWESASLGFYKDLEPAFVDVSQMLAKGSGSDAARDFLWKRLSEERAAVERRKDEEKIETSYAALVVYHQPEPQAFLAGIRQLKEADEAEFDSFREEVVGMVGEPVRWGFYTSADGRLYTAGLYRNLIETANRHREGLRGKLDPAVAALNANLTATVVKSDEEIVNRGSRPRKGSEVAAPAQR